MFKNYRDIFAYCPWLKWDSWVFQIIFVDLERVTIWWIIILLPSNNLYTLYEPPLILSSHYLNFNEPTSGSIHMNVADEKNMKLTYVFLKRNHPCMKISFVRMLIVSRCRNQRNHLSIQMRQERRLSYSQCFVSSINLRNNVSLWNVQDVYLAKWINRFRKEKVIKEGHVHTPVKINFNCN